MNERIEELKLKAIDFADATYKYDLSEGFKIQEWDAIRLNEFAKLVVQECAQVAHNKQYKHSPAHTVGDCATAIKEHFGVEE